MTIPELRVKTISDLGFTHWYGGPKDFRDLTAEEQLRVTDAMSLYVANHPNEFAAGTVSAASRWVNSGIIGQPLADTSFSATVSDFAGAIGDQAVSLNENLNPFSEKNRKWLLGALILFAALWWGGQAVKDSGLFKKLKATK